jgi:hypothetical protein
MNSAVIKSTWAPIEGDLLTPSRCCATFGGTKKRAVEVYAQFVEAELGQRSQEEYYRAAEGRLLGSEEFLDEVKHRVGDHRTQRGTVKKLKPLSIDELLAAAAEVAGGGT